MAESNSKADIKVKIAPEGTAEVVAALKRIQREGAETGRGAAGGVNLVTSAVGNLKRLLPTIGFAAAVTGVIALTRSAVNFFDAIGKGAERVGTTAETFSTLVFAAATADATTEDLETALARLAKTTGDVRRGVGENVDAFKELGISSDDLKGKDTGQIFALLAERLGRLPGDADKTRLALEILGRGGAKLIPLMNDIAERGFAAVTQEAAAFNAIVGGESVAAAKAINDNLKLVELSGKNLARSFVADFLPEVKNITVAMVHAAREAGVLEAILVGIGGAISLAFSGSEIRNTRQEIAELEGVIANTRRFIERGRTKIPFLPFDLQFNEEALASLKKNLAQQEAALKDAKARLEKLINPRGAVTPAAEAGDSFDAAKEIARFSKELKLEDLGPVREANRRRLEILAETQRIEQAALEARLATRKDVDAAQAELDRAAIARLKERAAVARDVFDQEIALANADAKALRERALKEATDEKGVVAVEKFAKLTAEIDKRAVAERTKAARGHYAALAQLATQHLDRYTQQQKKIIALDKEVTENAKQLAGILDAPKSLDKLAPGELQTRALELESKLESAAVRGNLEDARKARDELIKVVEQMQAIGETALARAFGESANRQFEFAARQVKTLAQGIADAAKAGADEAKKQAEEIKKTINDITQQDFGKIDLKVGLNTQSYRDLIVDLRQALANEFFTIKVRPEIGAAAGGPIPSLAAGGRVRGSSPTSYADDITIMATAGEFMQPVRAVRHYGMDFMEAIRRMELPRFAEGGLVGGNADGRGSDRTPDMVIELRRGGQTMGRLVGPRERLYQLVDDLRAMEQGTVG